MDSRAVLAGLVFVIIWSSAFSSARIIVAAASPLGALSLRFFISGLIAVAIARSLGQSWRLTAPQWRATIIFGVCQNALYLGLNFHAMQTIEASLASIIASTMPLLVALLGWAFFREKLSVVALGGLCAGFAGVAIIMGGRLAGEADLSGILLCSLGALALSFATLVVRDAISSGSLMMVIGLQMLIGSATLALGSLLTEEWRLDWSTAFVVAFVYTTLVPGLLATFLWVWLVERIGAIKAAAFHFLNPFFGVAIAAALLSEQIRTADIVGVIIIMIGILAVQLSKTQKT
ncbi:MAG: DMT family transporter [Pseudomonadota bacterium]